MSPIETYMIKNQMPIGDSGVTASTDMDLSEYHLSYFTYSNSYDEHGLTNGDSSILDGKSHVFVGGDGYKATLTLMRWIGAASEEKADLAYSECSDTSTIDPKYAYAYDVGHVTSVDWIEPSDINTVKQYLQEFGSAFIGYYYSGAYQGTNGAYCYISTSASNDYGPNHGVTLVGWDDNYSKSNFTGFSKPQNNGAWIVKNSWGNNSYTDNGYTYISYEDTSYLGHPIMFFTVDRLDTYDHLYQYDGTCFTGNEARGWIPLNQNRSLISNVFTAAGHEKVEAFSICTLEENMGYTLEVYKNPTNLTGSNPNPASGTLMSTQTGTIAHGGYHTIRIDSPFVVEAGDTFSAVFTLNSQQTGDGFRMVIPVDETETEEYTENGSYLATLIHTHVAHPGTSFFRLRDNSTWNQLDRGASLRIKAYTSDEPFALTVETGAHGTAVCGDYTPKGFLVTATPESGYYTSGYSIVSGNAAVLHNGNKLYVKPTEPSTIHIDFAAKASFTLTYSANGAQYGSTVTGTTGDAVTLPLTASAFEGFTFLGWLDAPLASAVSGKPLYLEPGSTYYPRGGNTTLYALYSFQGQTVPGQDGSYVKITSADEFTEGRYLMVNEASGHALDGSKANSAGMVAPINKAPNYIDVTINGDRIPDGPAVRESDFRYDPPTRQFYSSYDYPVSGYKDNYYFYVWGPTSTYGAVTVSFDESGNAVIYDDYYKKYLRYYDENPAYFAFKKTEGDPVQLYRKTEDTSMTFYSTSVDATPVTSWTVTFNSNGGSAVPAQTVVDGGTVIKPTDPTKDGFTFAGWFTDTGLTKAYNFSTPVTSSFTLYAKWTENAPVTHTVTFNSNGGSAVSQQTITDGGTVTKPTDPSRDGFNFVGWCSDPELANLYNFSTPVHSSFTLHAKWEDAPAPHTHTPGTAVEENFLAPNCTESGSYDSVIYCTACGQELSRTPVAVDPLGHDYKAVVTEPTCTEAGYTTHTCTRCGDAYTDTTTEALGHEWNEGTVTTEPSHQAPGEKTVTCTRCGETQTEVISQLDNPFEDVHETDFFFNPVMWALDETITGGIDETHFGPGNTVRRSDSMVFFWAAKGRPEFTTTGKTFKDVKSKHWAYPAVMWAVEHGITGGTDAAGTYFSPARTCTRCEILQFLYAAMEKPEYHIENPYSDVKNKHWYKDGAIWAYENGMEKGENGKFNAMTPCTRGSVVTYLYRFMTGKELAE